VIIKEIYWWVMSAFLICLLASTEVYNCTYDENGLLNCSLISGNSNSQDDNLYHGSSIMDDANKDESPWLPPKTSDLEIGI
jgi:hypothetical protein